MAQSILPLKVAGASVERRGKRLIGPVDVEINGRGITVVMGPNGSGKTTLLRLMHGLERPREGHVRWSAPEDVARARQSFVFQSPIVMRRSVTDCIAYPLILRGLGRRAARARAIEAAEAAGLGAHLDTPAGAVSGGERQKLALARALITEPDVLFLDEPCSNLDGRATREIEATLKRASDHGVRIVMSTHDLGQARRLADEVMFLAHGRVLERGPAGSVMDAPETEDARDFMNGRIVE